MHVMNNVHILSSYQTVCCSAVRPSGVEGQHALVVSSDEQCWWKVLCQGVQPGHVEEVRDGLLASDGHAPAGGEGDRGSDAGLLCLDSVLVSQQLFYLHNDQIG